MWKRKYFAKNGKSNTSKRKYLKDSSSIHFPLKLKSINV